MTDCIGPSDLRPRRKPSQSRSREMMAAILEAAAIVLERDGFKGYTTNAIAGRAGVSVGSLYQYFASKEAITAALILDAHDRLAGRLDALARRTANCTLEDSLSAQIAEVISTHLERPRLTRLLEMEEDRLPRTEELDEVEARIRAVTAGWLQPFLKADVVDQDLDLVASDVITIARSIFDSAYSRGRRLDHKVEQRVHAAVMGYLSPLRA